MSMKSDSHPFYEIKLSLPCASLKKSSLLLLNDKLMQRPDWQKKGFYSSWLFGVLFLTALCRILTPSISLQTRERAATFQLAPSFSELHIADKGQAKSLPKTLYFSATLT